MTLARVGDGMRFEKVLWRKQPFPDNYVAESFLSDLKTNSQVVLPGWQELVLASMRVSARFLSVVLFALLFVHLHLATLDAEFLLVVALFCFTLVAISSSANGEKNAGGKRRKHKAVGGVLTKIIVGLVLLAVSPVLRTLTESTTSDSIWALSAVLFSIHLALADYSAQRQAKKLTHTLSLNAAISASVVLASRLDTNSDTFTLLTLAILLFSPANRHIPHTSTIASRQWIPFATLYTLTMVVGLSFGTEHKGWVYVVLGWINVTLVFISLVCPSWIRVAQGWKMEIKGPWDPAEPVLCSTTTATTRV